MEQQPTYAPAAGPLGIVLPAPQKTQRPVAGRHRGADAELREFVIVVAATLAVMLCGLLLGFAAITGSLWP